nr:MAG TPA: NAD(P)H dehydrogenase subunit S [Caudoviricetes sp.]
MLKIGRLSKIIRKNWDKLLTFWNTNNIIILWNTKSEVKQ